MVDKQADTEVDGEDPTPTPTPSPMIRSPSEGGAVGHSRGAGSADRTPVPASAVRQTRTPAGGNDPEPESIGGSSEPQPPSLPPSVQATPALPRADKGHTAGGGAGPAGGDPESNGEQD